MSPPALNAANDDLITFRNYPLVIIIAPKTINAMMTIAMTILVISAAEPANKALALTIDSFSDYSPVEPNPPLRTPSALSSSVMS